MPRLESLRCQSSATLPVSHAELASGPSCSATVRQHQSVCILMAPAMVCTTWVVIRSRYKFTSQRSRQPWFLSLLGSSVTPPPDGFSCSITLKTYGACCPRGAASAQVGRLADTLVADIKTGKPNSDLSSGQFWLIFSGFSPTGAVDSRAMLPAAATRLFGFPSLVSQVAGWVWAGHVPSRRGPSPQAQILARAGYCQDHSLPLRSQRSRRPRIARNGLGRPKYRPTCSKAILGPRQRAVPRGYGPTSGGLHGLKMS